jgi:hypothetical protein
MVHIRDEGVFDAPLEKIWKYIGDDTPGLHKHRAIPSTKVLSEEGNVVVQEMQIMNADGKGTHWETWRLTMNPPRGYQVEAIAGPTKGTKFAQTYTSMGNRTRVDVEGDWVVPGADDATIRKMTLAFLEEAFNEDTAALKKYK